MTQDDTNCHLVINDARLNRNNLRMRTYVGETETKL